VTPNSARSCANHALPGIATALSGRCLATNRRCSRTSKSIGSIAWLDALAALILRPRLAFATVATLILAGVLLGTYQGTQVARQDAQAHYLAIVAPNSLR